MTPPCSATGDASLALSIDLKKYPALSPFVLDWLGGDTRFLPRGGAPRPPRGPRNREALVDALVESNKRWGIFAGDALRKWNDGQTATVIAGQQVGFAGGPLYTAAKLASLLKLKRENEARGIETTVFFWLATEDHDFHEVAQLTLPVKHDAKRQRDLISLRAARGVETKDVVGPQQLPAVLVDELLAFYDMPRPEWLREGITFRDSFAELIATTFGRDVILVDALLPELRRAGEPLFDAITTKWDRVQHELATRSAELQRAGYAPQVVPRDGEPYTLLFELDDHGNREIVTDPRPLPSPERVSTSALTRPLLQDFVFEPDVFVGGPSEVAYYAQIAPLHDLLGIAMPRVALRGHALVAPRRIVRSFERYVIDPAEIFGDTDALLAEREPEGVAKIHAISRDARRELAKRITEIGELALPAEHALARAISRSIGHIEYHFDKLAERAVRGLVRKDRERYAAIRELVATLYPDRQPQDRIVSWFAYWSEYGDAFVDRLIEHVQPDTPTCSIIAL